METADRGDIDQFMGLCVKTKEWGTARYVHSGGKAFGVGIGQPLLFGTGGRRAGQERCYCGSQTVSGACIAHPDQQKEQVLRPRVAAFPDIPRFVPKSGIGFRMAGCGENRSWGPLKEIRLHARIRTDCGGRIGRTACLCQKGTGSMEEANIITNKAARVRILFSPSSAICELFVSW